MTRIKYVGRFNESAVKKTFKKVNTLIQKKDDHAYITEGHVIARVTLDELEMIQNVITPESITERDGLDKVFKGLVSEELPATEFGPDVIARSGSVIAALKTNDDTVTSLFNRTYIDVFTGFIPTLNTIGNGNNKAAVYTNGDGEPVGAVMPIKDDRIKKMFAALLEPAEPEPEKVVTYESHRDIAKAEPEPTPEPVAEEPTPEPQPEPSSLADKANTYKATFEKLAGVTVLVKGEKTACPIVWIGGETKPHKDQLKAAGCKWAPKKKMWYIHVA